MLSSILFISKPHWKPHFGFLLGSNEIIKPGLGLILDWDSVWFIPSNLCTKYFVSSQSRCFPLTISSPVGGGVWPKWTKPTQIAASETDWKYFPGEFYSFYPECAKWRYSDQNLESRVFLRSPSLTKFSPNKIIDISPPCYLFCVSHIFCQI